MGLASLKYLKQLSVPVNLALDISLEETVLFLKKHKVFLGEIIRSTKGS